MIITGKKFSKPEMSRVINGDRELGATSDKPAKIRLDHLLKERYPDFNRSSLQKFIKAGRVKVNGEVIMKANYAVLPGSEVALELPADLAQPELKAERIAAARPEAIYEDANVLVVNKPAGLLSMAKGEYCPEPTLEDYGLLVHRLDRDTSGVVILAKDPATQSMLRRQFQERKAHKLYYAVVVGAPKLDEALVKLPLARNLKRPTTFQVDAAGKPAETYYRVMAKTELSAEAAASLGLAAGQVLSLLELKPKTGRTHQLRVHLKYLGTPILGDPVYGELPQHNHAKAAVPATQAPRLYLHASSLEITIPGSPENQRKIFTATLPAAFTQLFPGARE